MAQRRRSIEEREPTLRHAPGGSEYWYFLSHKKEHSQHGRVPAAIAQSLHDSLHQLGYRGWFDVGFINQLVSMQAPTCRVANCIPATPPTFALALALACASAIPYAFLEWRFDWPPGIGESVRQVGLVAAAVALLAALGAAVAFARRRRRPEHGRSPATETEPILVGI